MTGRNLELWPDLDTVAGGAVMAAALCPRLAGVAHHKQVPWLAGPLTWPHTPNNTATAKIATLLFTAFCYKTEP